MESEEGTIITRNQLKRVSGEFELAAIQKLTLNNEGITSLGCIGDCVLLEHLDLSHNRITTLYNLSSLVQLTDLNLSHNAIKSLEGLQTLEQLRMLNLAGNLLESVDCLWNISSLKHLWSLTLRTDDSSNPFFNTCYTYKQQVTTILPHLSILDGECIHNENGDIAVTFKDIEYQLKALEDSDKQTSFTTTKDNLSALASQEIPKVNPKATQINDMEEKILALIATCHTLTQKGQKLIDSAIDR